jgi:hypothetical protein
MRDGSVGAATRDCIARLSAWDELCNCLGAGAVILYQPGASSTKYKLDVQLKR